MRGVVLILVALQLLLNGVAHSCVHVPATRGAGHLSRPHIHLTGHSHHSGHAHGGHGHSHSTTDEKTASADAATSPMEPEHDHDAVYVSCDLGLVSIPRVFFPGPDAALVISLSSANLPTGQSHLQHFCDDGSRSGAGIQTQRMPHQLRI